MNALAPIGRLLFSAMFIFSGLNHFIQLESVAAHARDSGIPEPRLAALLSGVMLLMGGLFVLFGIFARVGAALIGLFLLTAAFTVHSFWAFDDPQMAQQQQVHFMKNLSLAGGALLIMYFGPGPFSLRRRKQARERRPPLGAPLRHRTQE